MKLILRKIKISNFKGIKEVELDFNEDITVIAGRNESGKTTINDAFNWCLFGKDSYARTKFDIIPNDETGSKIEGVNPTVELSITVDKNQHFLKRVLATNWKDGIYKGSQQELFIDGVPVALGEFNSFIYNIISEDNFKILSSLKYFNEVLSWKDRRGMLIDLIDTVYIQDLALNKPFGDIRQDIVNLGIDKAELKYKAELKEVKSELGSLPARIEEVSVNINKDDSPNFVLRGKKSQLEKQLQELRTKALEESRQADKVLIDRIAEVSAQISKLTSGDDIKKAMVDKLNQLKSSNNSIQDSIKSLSAEIRIKEDKLKENDLQRKELGATYQKHKSSSFDDNSIYCPTCKQELPAEDIDKIKKDFEQTKTTEMDKAWKLATDLKKLSDIIESEIKSKQDEIVRLKEQLIANDEDIAELEAKIEDDNQSDDAMLLEGLNNEKQVLENQLKSFKQDPYHIPEIEETTRELESINQQLIGFEASHKAKARVEELTAKLSEVSNNKLEIERKLDLLGKLRVKYVSQIEEDINKIFNQKIKVKLFDSTLDGKITETCEILYKSKQGSFVPYPYVNTAGQINCSLQIINTLANKLDLFCPVFVDNADSVDSLNDIFKTDSQMILLEKVKSYKEVTVK